MLVFSWRTESSLTQHVFLGREVIFDTYVFGIPFGPTRPQALAHVVVCPRRRTNLDGGLFTLTGL